MAIPRGEYMKKFEAIFPQVLENLVLLLYARNTGGRYTRWMGHWGIELKGQMKTLSRYTLKKNNSYDNRYKAIAKVIEANDWSTNLAIFDVLPRLKSWVFSPYLS